MDRQTEAFVNLLTLNAEAYAHTAECITHALESIHRHIATLPETEQATLQPWITSIETATQRLCTRLDDLNSLRRDLERL